MTDIRDPRGTLYVERLPVPSQRETARGGFTLIETALALLAIGLGLLGVFEIGRASCRERVYHPV